MQAHRRAPSNKWRDRDGERTPTSARRFMTWCRSCGTKQSQHIVSNHHNSLFSLAWRLQLPIFVDSFSIWTNILLISCTIFKTYFSLSALCSALSLADENIKESQCTSHEANLIGNGKKCLLCSYFALNDLPQRYVLKHSFVFLQHFSVVGKTSSMKRKCLCILCSCAS